MRRYSILEYSTRSFRYAYPQISAVEGPVSGMEYAMVGRPAGTTGPISTMSSRTKSGTCGIR